MDYFLVIVFLAVFASLLRDGLWSNLVTLFSAVTAALVATNYFEPVAGMLTGLVPSMLHFWGLIALGLVFVAVFILLRTLGLKASRFRVRFHPPVDNFGGVAVAGVCGWLAVMFVCFGMHLAPMSRTYLGNSFDPERRMFFGMAPDRLWLGFAQKLSNNGAWGRNVNADGEVTSMFDPKSEYMLKHASRRAWLAEQADTFAD
ncbi:MAG: CvpA family protein [Pirellulales bacterium]